jgi:hypothetical protein
LIFDAAAGAHKSTCGLRRLAAGAASGQVGIGERESVSSALAHDRAKCEWFADKIKRQINLLARDRMQNRRPLLLIALVPQPPRGDLGALCK